MFSRHGYETNRLRQVSQTLDKKASTQKVRQIVATEGLAHFLCFQGSYQTKMVGQVSHYLGSKEAPHSKSRELNKTVAMKAHFLFQAIGIGNSCYTRKPLTKKMTTSLLVTCRA